MMDEEKDKMGKKIEEEEEEERARLSIASPGI